MTSQSHAFSPLRFTFCTFVPNEKANSAGNWLTVYSQRNSILFAFRENKTGTPQMFKKKIGGSKVFL